MAFIARQKRKTALPFPFISQPMGFMFVCACVFSISPPDHISFNTIALAQHKLVELVLHVIVCL